MAEHRNGFVNALFRCLKMPDFWCIFIWPPPLGLLRVKRLDRWIIDRRGMYTGILSFLKEQAC
jgi:hypothetical protein